MKTNSNQSLSNIKISAAKEHNLKDITVTIPHNRLTVVTGVSGSGKSSLVYDILYREAQRKFMESYSSHARQYLGKMQRPKVNRIEGLRPTIAVDQTNVIRNSRSTVGTLTEILDLFRLLFARAGRSKDSELQLNRSLFSFNSAAGSCPHCKGLGVEDRIDPNLIIKDPSKTLREGALAITTPSGYTIYSQVTIDVLDQVCNAHGFNVDIPWEKLSEENRKVIFNGSNRLKIPFGKHSLESRMKWSGITAKPREEGYYKGILPVMEEILRRDRNPNILRFVQTIPCSKCKGSRYSPEALSVTWEDDNIAHWCNLSIEAIAERMTKLIAKEEVGVVAKEIGAQILSKAEILIKLGVGYLSLDRESTTLSGGEQQRIHIANQVNQGMQNILYILDEPSIGLHAQENRNLIEILRELVRKGNTVVIVEHDEDFILAADWIIDIGPKAGREGGELLFCGSMKEYLSSKISTPTLDYLKGQFQIPFRSNRRGNGKFLLVKGAEIHNLKKIDVKFSINALNVVSGVSGAGKSSLVMDLLAQKLKNDKKSIKGAEAIQEVVCIDQTPIGKTPRSNPATYTKLADLIRNLYANLPEPKEKGWKKGMFSFNVKGGRCEKCEGAGVLQIGMHFMGNVTVPCPECEEKRFKPEVLEVQYQGKNISDVFQMRISEARDFFYADRKMTSILDTLMELGLGYLSLGQSSSTLSGGEAQRIKLATHLAAPSKKSTLYILDEPTGGLHFVDVAHLLEALNRLVKIGHTVVVIEHHPDLIRQADWLIDLGPGSGKNGGMLCGMGTPEQVADVKNSPTSKFLSEWLTNKPVVECSQEANSWLDHSSFNYSHTKKTTVLRGITTHNLKGIDWSIPHGKMTVVTGVSGSGKSSLAFDTLFAEAERCFNRSMSAYVRSRLGSRSQGSFDSCHNLIPCIAISQDRFGTSPRSTVGTLSEIYEIYRLLYARIGQQVNSSGKSEEANHRLASYFSFNHQNGSCRHCKGLGSVWVANPDLLITNPEKSLLDGALGGTKIGKFYGDPKGQYVACLKTVGAKYHIDFTKAYEALSPENKKIALWGCDDELFNVNWEFKRGNRQGVHEFTGTWKGFANLVNEEYERKKENGKVANLLHIMHEKPCPVCKGQRLRKQALEIQFKGMNIWELSEFSVNRAIEFWTEIRETDLRSKEKAVLAQLHPAILKKLDHLKRLGLGYLTLNRSTETLSGGEAQRLRIATQLGTEMQDICYVLDEPTRGLHHEDIEGLLKVLEDLKSKGNTLVVVEHNAKIILQADKIVELGPTGGNFGGHLIASGSLHDLLNNPRSLTAPYLNSRGFNFDSRDTFKGKHEIRIRKACANNLKKVDLRIPTGGLIGLVGVSGSGKSSLLREVIWESAQKQKAINCDQITGLENFGQIILLEQKCMGKSPSSTPASYSGLMNLIRKCFIQTEEAKQMHLKPSLFSFNSKEGACPKCKGMGSTSIKMDFLSDIWMECEACKGTRYNLDALQWKFHGKTIAEVMEMTISEALAFFEMEAKIQKALVLLEEVGLGYIKLGQPSNQLSGGEAQRLRLATELIKPGKEINLFLLDEPCSGLHFQDLENMVVLFKKLALNGHTIIFADHHEQLIAQADYLIELGPKGGDEGGTFVAQGSPIDLLAKFTTKTTKVLQDLEKL
ncbi:MAG: excinuclease ABC subunit UvrA [Marinifilaceae bacterium]